MFQEAVVYNERSWDKASTILVTSDEISTILEPDLISEQQFMNDERAGRHEGLRER